MRRLLVCVEHSIDKGTQWVVFEPNGVTQDDIDNGRLICLIGMAPMRPAEFVVFRISQTTADAGTHV